MAEVITLPPGVALSILAFLLSLVPAGLFLWLWYLRRQDRAVPASLVAVGLVGGMILVAPAFYLETWVAKLWDTYFPATVFYYQGTLLPIQGWADILLPAIGTFLVVATIEEGLRYLLLTGWFRVSSQMDQVFDGLVIGTVAGLGFATLENTVYFWNLFSQGSFNTLVVVFFLRFLISTLAHISFGGIMGALLAQGMFSIYRPGRLYWLAFIIPWGMHGLYDLLLTLNLGFYAVILLALPLAILVFWSSRREFFAINRKNGQRLIAQQAPETREARVLKKFFKAQESPWNTLAPWLNEKRRQRTLLSHLEQHDEYTSA